MVFFRIYFDFLIHARMTPEDVNDLNSKSPDDEDGVVPRPGSDNDSGDDDINFLLMLGHKMQKKKYQTVPDANDALMAINLGINK